MDSTAIGIRTTIISLTVALISVVIYEVLINVPFNGCTMTWMYEYPEYIKVPLPTTVEKRFKKYSLFVYGEGAYADSLRSMNGHYKLNGIPVLFVHGNAGRYKQVRSPASVCLRKSESRPYHFNYFSVDYEEELSALYGPYLNEQTRYLYHAIKRIFRCYSHLPKNKRPQSIIAIGHSMGGLVLRGSLTQPWLPGQKTLALNQVNTIITLASPHQKPPLAFDEDLVSYYKKVNAYWSLESLYQLENITTLSLGGGVRDYLVRSDLCYLCGISNNTSHMSVTTSGLSNIWLSTDHQCIVWCNELVRAVTRALFNMIDPKTAQITEVPDLRRSVFQDIFFSTYNELEDLDSSECEELEVNENVTINIIKPNKCLLLTSNSVLNGYRVNIWVKTLKKKWMYSCTRSLKQCKSIEYTVLPSRSGNSKFVSFVLNNEEVTMLKLVHGDKLTAQAVFSESSQSLTDSAFFPINYEAEFDSVFFINISVSTFTEPWQVFQVVFHGDLKENFLVQMFVPWTNESEFYLINGSHNAFLMKMFSRKPDIHQHVQLRIWRQTPFRRIQFTLKPAISQCFSQLLHANIETVLRYGVMFSVIRALLHTDFGGQPLALLMSKRQLYRRLAIMLTIRYLIYTFLIKGLFTLRRFFIPQICLVAFSLLVADTTIIVLATILKILQVIIYPVSFLIQKIGNSSPRYSVQALGVCLLALFIYNKIPAAVCLLALIIVNIIQINTIKDAKDKMFRTNVFLTLLPTCLVFCAVPTIVFVKDTMEGFPHEHGSFLNLTTLAVVFCLHIGSHVWVPYLAFLKNSHVSKFVKGILFTMTMLSLQERILVFYRIVYVVALYLFCSHFIHTD